MRCEMSKSHTWPWTQGRPTGALLCHFTSTTVVVLIAVSVVTTVVSYYDSTARLEIVKVWSFDVMSFPQSWREHARSYICGHVYNLESVNVHCAILTVLSLHFLLYQFKSQTCMPTGNKTVLLQSVVVHLTAPESATSCDLFPFNSNIL